MAKSYYDYLNEVLKSQQSAKDSELMALEEKYNAEKKVKSKEYADKIKEVDTLYNSQIDNENIKRLIEERKIKEAIGNMGLSDSGYGKIKNSGLKHKLNVTKLQKQNVGERLNLQDKKDKELEKIEGEKLEKQAKVEENFLKDAERNALSLYKESNKSSGSKKNTKNTNNDKPPQKSADSTPEYVYDNSMVKLTPEQLEEISVFIEDADILSRQEYANERRLDKTVPTYQVYVLEELNKAQEEGYIDEKQFKFLKQYYNVN